MEVDTLRFPLLEVEDLLDVAEPVDEFPSFLSEPGDGTACCGTLAVHLDGLITLE